MGSGVLALDVVWSAVFFFAGKWTPALKRNQSRDLLRFLLCRLYDESRGQLVNGQVTLAQGTLARKLGLSRQWIGILLDRLQHAGWIEYYAPVLDDGMRGSTIFRVGRQLKRLLVMLRKSKQRKTPTKSDVHKRGQFHPSPEVKRLKTVLARENTPPKPELLKHIPLLGNRSRGGQALKPAKNVLSRKGTL